MFTFTFKIIVVTNSICDGQRAILHEAAAMQRDNPSEKYLQDHRQIHAFTQGGLPAHFRGRPFHDTTQTANTSPHQFHDNQPRLGLPSYSTVSTSLLQPFWKAFQKRFVAGAIPCPSILSQNWSHQYTFDPYWFILPENAGRVTTAASYSWRWSNPSFRCIATSWLYVGLSNYIS